MQGWVGVICPYPRFKTTHNDSSVCAILLVIVVPLITEIELLIIADVLKQLGCAAHSSKWFEVPGKAPLTFGRKGLMAFCSIFKYLNRAQQEANMYL